MCTFRRKKCRRGAPGRDARCRVDQGPRYQRTRPRAHTFLMEGPPPPLRPQHPYPLLPTPPPRPCHHPPLPQDGTPSTPPEAMTRRPTPALTRSKRRTMPMRPSPLWTLPRARPSGGNRPSTTATCGRRRRLPVRTRCGGALRPLMRSCTWTRNARGWTSPRLQYLPARQRPGPLGTPRPKMWLTMGMRSLACPPPRTGQQDRGSKSPRLFSPMASQATPPLLGLQRTCPLVQRRRVWERCRRHPGLASLALHPSRRSQARRR